jgi:hypothetical protein
MAMNPRVWYPVAAILSAVNVAGVAFAVLPGEPWHATIHAALAVGFGVWAQSLRIRRQASRNSADFLNQLGQHFQWQGLFAVGQGCGGVGVAFDQEAIGSGGNSRSCCRDDQVGTAGGVAGVGDDGEGADLFDQGNGVGIEGVAGGSVEAANTPFAQDNAFVTPAGDMFGGLQPFLNS